MKWVSSEMKNEKFHESIFHPNIMINGRLRIVCRSLLMKLELFMEEKSCGK